MMKPFIAKVAYYVLPEEEFDEVLEVVEEHVNGRVSVRELDNGDVYFEFEVQSLDKKELPVIGDIGKLGVDIIHIWLDN